MQSGTDTGWAATPSDKQKLLAMLDLQAQLGITLPIFYAEKS
jgi:hypothetical protein